MNRADTWLSNRPNMPEWQRNTNANSVAIDTAARIADSPTLIVLYRKAPGVKGQQELPAQVCRIEIIQSIRSAGEQHDFQMTTAKQYVVILALRDHPSLPNFDVLRADWCFHQGRRYEVVEIDDKVPGRLLISAELTP